MLSLWMCLLISCSTACNNDTAIKDTEPIIDTSIIIKQTVADSFPVQKIIASVVCKNDASQSYTLYIPSAEAEAVIYFFDPHADGVLPLEKYKALANAYNYILIGSNNSKNGNDWQTTESIWQTLFNDTKSRISLNTNRIYTCGFSGGAKVASYIAMHHPEIKAVIAGGAGLPDDATPNNFNFNFTGIAGKGDMNMNNLVALNNAFDKTQTKHRIILFDGKHEWTPASTMDIAFAGLELDAMRNNSIKKNDSLTNVCINNSKKRIEHSLQKEDYIQASDECILSVNMLESLTDVSFFKQKNNAIINNTSYKNELMQQQKLFLIEENKKTEYNDKFQSGDINYWNNSITDLNTKAKGTTPEAAMYQRLLAYLSLAFYSISNQLINQNQNDAANYYVTLYKLADPTNSEAWYFSALLNARNNNSKAASDDLLKAADNGFSDERRMLQQNEFQTLQPPINFNLLEAKMQQKQSVHSQ